jgi:cellulose synthase/poly-beta-1,6-N-acetylglucosamine synthase-like glycosyltransferase
MPFKALVDVGFWQSDVVTDDSRIFLQCLMEYDGDYRVTPVYIPISMDTVSTPKLLQTMKNQYKQQRRWAYGVENFPYMAWNFSVNKRISFFKKFKYIWNQLEGVYSWATAPILIFILGWLPVTIANHQQNTALIVQTAPRVLEMLMRYSMVGLLTAAVISTILLPRPKKNHMHPLRIVPMILQWVLFPLTMIVFGAIPATDAQTRLMFARYLGFWVTEKTRTNRESSAS